MDKELRKLERGANFESAVQEQAKLARAQWRAGRLLEAYDIYQQHSLLEKEHPDAVALAKEMAAIQKPFLEKLPTSWNLYRCYPGWARLTDAVKHRALNKESPIDTICLDWPTTLDERESLAATPFIRGLKIIREKLPIDWTVFLQCKSLENLWLFFHNNSQALNGLEQLTHIKRMKLFCDAASLESVKTLSQISSLEELVIYQNGRPIQQLQGLTDLFKLKQFILGLNEFNPKRLEQLLNIRSLTHIFLPQCELNSDQLNQLKALPKIEVIQWGEDQVFQKDKTRTKHAN